jgi:hypothetical protein
MERICDPTIVIEIGQDMGTPGKQRVVWVCSDNPIQIVRRINYVDRMIRSLNWTFSLRLKKNESGNGITQWPLRPHRIRGNNRVSRDPMDAKLAE